MRKLLLSILLTLIEATMFGQGIWDINFEDATTLQRVVIDTASNPTNTWQIGHPDKSVFTTAHSDPYAIVTDTVHPYPTNDTSAFTVIHIASSGWELGYPKVDIGGYYSVESDTLTDFGYIDFSADHGITWTRADSSEGICTWGAEEDLPTFTGNSNGWKHFYYCLQVPTTVFFGDTILYRFTFISDSIQTNKDGLMFDDLHFEDWSEGVQEIRNDNLISISPNPVSNELTIHASRTADNEKIQILNSTGRIILDNSHFTGSAIDTRQLKNGIYLLRYSDTMNFSIKKFEVQH